MEAKRRVKRALDAIDEAEAALRNARGVSREAQVDIDRALSELDDAETHLRRLRRELPDE